MSRPTTTKAALALCVLLTLSGCGWVSRENAKLFGQDQTCIDGVTYIQFPSGVSVKYDRDGKVVRCE